MTTKISRDTENYVADDGSRSPVDIIETWDEDLKKPRHAAFHYFNDGAGMSVSVRCELGMAHINISRADTLAILARLNELFAEGSLQA